MTVGRWKGGKVGKLKIVTGGHEGGNSELGKSPSALSYRTVFTDYQAVSRKIPGFRHVIPNAFVDLPELGGASP